MRKYIHINYDAQMLL